MAELLMTPVLARDLRDHYGDLETAAASAEASPEWEHTFAALPRETPRMERVAWFFRFLDDERPKDGAWSHEPASRTRPGPEPKPLKRAAVMKAIALLEAGTSLREIARQTGIDRHQVAKIDAYRSGRGYDMKPGPIENTVVLREIEQNERRAADRRRWPPKVAPTDSVIY